MIKIDAKKSVMKTLDMITVEEVPLLRKLEFCLVVTACVIQQSALTTNWMDLGDPTHVSKKDNHVNKKNILIQLERMADGMAKQRNIDLNMLIPS